MSFQKNFFISDDPLTFDQKLFTHPNQGELLHLIQICEKSKILSKENYNILLKTEKIPQEIFSILEVLEKNNIALKEKDLNELLQSKSLYLILSFLDVLKDSNCLNESSAPILLNNSLNENTLLNAINTLLDLKDYPKNAKFMSYLLDFLQSSFSETADQKSYNDTLFKAMTLNNPDSVIKLSFNEFKESCIQNLLSVCEKNRYKVVIGEDFFHVFPASDKRNNFFTSQDSPLTTTLNKLFTAIQKSKSVSDIEETLKEQNNIPNFSIFCNYVIKNKSLVSNETTQSLKSTT